MAPVFARLAQCGYSVRYRFHDETVRAGVVFARVAAMRRQLASSLTNEMALLIHGSAANFVVSADVVFTPHSRFRTGWDLLMVLLTLYCCIQVATATRTARTRRRRCRHWTCRRLCGQVPWVAAFQAEPSGAWLALEIIVELLFFFDIFLAFRTVRT
jgi:hypothetical protein